MKSIERFGIAIGTPFRYSDRYTLLEEDEEQDEELSCAHA